MPELLVEFLSEEVPARMQRRAADDLERLLSAALVENELEFGSICVRATPRRLAVQADGLPASRPSRRVERKGPRTNAPEKAIAGFAGSIPIPLDRCEIREDAKGPFYAAVWDEPGRPTPDVLGEIIPQVALAMPWPKSMRWGRSSLRWVRPLHGVLALFDGAPVPGGLDTGDGTLAFSARTRGHRFMAPAEIAVDDFADYEEKLRAAKVLVRSGDREDSIREQLEKLCGERGLAAPDDPALYAEVAGLVEWPVVHIGTIDPGFMELPAEVLVTSMREHQKYFSLAAADGALAPSFAFVSNVETDDPQAVIRGNERVLRARLSDARYFWDLDRAIGLEDLAGRLDAVVFHARLGSVGEKVGRIESLAMRLADAVPGADPRHVARAAQLSKADLASGMVTEFPELQGVMGRHYALAQGEPPEVADAIAEHRSPRGPADDCPAAPASVALALADKLDTLVGFWSIGEKPTGSGDPYALRRAALGVIRIVLESRIRLGMRDAFAGARAGYGCDDPGIDEDLLDFLAERLKAHLRGEGVRHDHVEAVFGLRTGDDLVGIVERARALGGFLASDDGANLLTAYRRAANIVRDEEKKDSTVYRGDAYDPGPADSEPVERALWDALTQAEEMFGAVLASEDFAAAMAILAGMRAPVDEFFDRVTVNVDDAAIRENRLRLLARVQGVMDNVADFSRVEGG